MTKKSITEVKTEDLPTREQLIELCIDGLVKQDRWTNRDSAGAQRQLGEARVLLEAGCEYSFTDNSHKCWWVDIFYRGFGWFEGGFDSYENRDYYLQHDSFYIPMRESIKADGGDWY